MKAAEIKGLSIEDITAQLADLRRKYHQSRQVHYITQMENPIQLRNDRKNIARLATELRRRELENAQQHG